jgi:uncharacterized membrane protein YjjP (DUF1212 family)
VTSERHSPRLGARARRAIAGREEPTVQIGLRSASSSIDDLAAHAVLELALRIGEAMLALGVAAADVTTTVLRVAAAYGLERCQVDVTFTSLTVSWDRDDAVPLTGLRIVRARTQDYTRLQAVTDLAHEVSAGTVPVDEAHRRLDAAVRAPHPYQRWVVTAALAGLAAAVGFLLGGGPLVALVAAVSTAGVDQLMRLLGRWGLPQFFQQVAGAALATTAAVVVLGLGLPVRTSVLVAAGIVVLLAGLGLVGAAEDAISGFHVTAAARGAEVLTLTAGIVVGIAAVLDLARRLQLPLSVLGPGDAGAPVAVQVPAAAAVAGFFAVSAYARPRAALVAALAGGLAWTTFEAASLLGVAASVASALAAAVVGFVGGVVTDRLRVPPQLVAVCGIVALLPGLAIYRGLFWIIVEGNLQAGLGSLTGALATGLALAAGVTLGEFLATPVRTGVDRFERAVRRHAAPPE